MSKEIKWRVSWLLCIAVLPAAYGLISPAIRASEVSELASWANDAGKLRRDAMSIAWAYRADRQDLVQTWADTWITNCERLRDRAPYLMESAEDMEAAAGRMRKVLEESGKMPEGMEYGIDLDCFQAAEKIDSAIERSLPLIHTTLGGPAVLLCRVLAVASYTAVFCYAFFEAAHAKRWTYNE